jgi:hypothetical protein
MIYLKRISDSGIFKTDADASGFPGCVPATQPEIDAFEAARTASAAASADALSHFTIDTFGAPAQTLKQLAAMDWPTWSAWIDGNLTSVAACKTFCKYLGFLVLKRIITNGS